MKSLKLAIFATHSIDTFVVWTNTDLTEGRGSEYAFAVCKIEATAKRLARGNYVMGTDCRYTKEKAYYIGNTWYMAGGQIIQPNDKDIDEEKELQLKKENELKKTAAIEKARKLGLSEEDIKNLKL